ncbi:MAG: Phosphoglycolate phosphatase [Bacteroidia bacterium]|nr:Phosphoglycolate phosphatase [Bacteroidia bacterium]MCK6383166.1 HAD hydrolase-like protein [Rhodocyclaceae bacterium]
MSMHPPRFDAIVFDFDGVLVESVDVKTRAFASLYEPYGAEVVKQVVAWHLAHGGVSRYEKFRHFHQAFLGRTLAPAEESELGERFSALVEKAVIAAAWVPGAREFLEEWHARLPLYVASGTPEEELLRIVARRGMARYFAGVAGAPRKKGEILRDFLDRCGALPARLLMVGDAMTDFDGAAEAGVPFLGIVADGANPFPPGVPVLPDLNSFAAFLQEQTPALSGAARP